MLFFWPSFARSWMAFFAFSWLSQRPPAHHAAQLTSLRKEGTKETKRKKGAINTIIITMADETENAESHGDGIDSNHSPTGSTGSKLRKKRPGRAELNGEGATTPPPPLPTKTTSDNDNSNHNKKSGLAKKSPFRGPNPSSNSNSNSNSNANRSKEIRADGSVPSKHSPRRQKPKKKVDLNEEDHNEDDSGHGVRSVNGSVPSRNSPRRKKPKKKVNLNEEVGNDDDSDHGGRSISRKNENKNNNRNRAVNESSGRGERSPPTKQKNKVVKHAPRNPTLKPAEKMKGPPTKESAVNLNGNLSPSPSESSSSMSSRSSLSSPPGPEKTRFKTRSSSLKNLTLSEDEEIFDIEKGLRELPFDGKDDDDDEDDFDNGGMDVKGPRRTVSYLQSLAVVEAQIEVSAQDDSLVVTNEVTHVKQSQFDANLDSSPSRASVISVTFFKESPDTNVGLSFRNERNHLVVAEVSPTGLLDGSPVQVGDHVLSLDDNYCSTWSVRKAETYLAHKSDLISILVKNPRGKATVAAAVLYKRSFNDKIGLSFTTDGGRLKVRKINEAGLLGTMSALRPGDYVEFINNVPCKFMEPKAATKLVLGAEKMVTIITNNSDAAEISIRDMSFRTSSRRLSSEIVAMSNDPINLNQSDEETDELTPAHVSVKVFKQDRTTRLGLILDNQNDILTISQVKGGCLFSNSPLKAGYNLFSINGTVCQHWNATYALDFLLDAVGELYIVGLNPDGDHQYVHAMAYKSSPGAPIGLGFKMSVGPLKINSIRGDGIFGSSVLNPDDEVISINNVSCLHIPPTDAANIVKQAPDIVSILAKSSSTSGVVLATVPLSSTAFASGSYSGAGSNPRGTEHDSDSKCQNISCILVCIIFSVIALSTRI